MPVTDGIFLINRSSTLPNKDAILIFPTHQLSESLLLNISRVLLLLRTDDQSPQANNERWQ